MPDTTFTFRLDAELKAAFAEVAEAQERTAAQLLRVLMKDTVQRWHDNQAHDDWFRDEVRKGLQEAQDPHLERVRHDHVQTSWRHHRAGLERRATGRSA